jgi:hypothetical protein
MAREAQRIPEEQSATETNRKKSFNFKGPVSNVKCCCV